MESKETTRKRARRPDAEPFDEVHMIIKPRYKMSAVSGNEWRTRVYVTCKHKGNEVLSFSRGTMEDAIDELKTEIGVMQQMQSGLYFGKGSFCDQEGCADLAEYIYKMKMKFNRHGIATDANEGLNSVIVRHFCEHHSVRGNYIGQSDNDDNYEILQSPACGPVLAPESNLSIIHYPAVEAQMEPPAVNKDIPIMASDPLVKVWGISKKGEWVECLIFNLNEEDLAIQIAQYREDLWPLQVRHGDHVIKEFGINYDNKLNI